MKKLFVFAQVVVLMMLFALPIGLAEDAVIVGVLHVEMEYPPPAGEMITTYPEPGNPGFSLSVPSPVKPGDPYPITPDRVGLVTDASGVTYWVNVPESMGNWRAMGDKAVRITIAGDADGNDLTVFDALSFEVIGEAAMGVITAMGGNEITVLPNVGDGSEIVLLVVDDSVFRGNPQVWDECQFMYDENYVLISVVKGEG